MKAKRPEAQLLSELMPGFAEELEHFLTQCDRPILAAAVRELRVHDRCSCNDPRCSSFYAVPRRQAAWLWWGSDQESVSLATGGTVRVDAAGGNIVSVEVLDREDVQLLLERVLPKPAR